WARISSGLKEPGGTYTVVANPNFEDDDEWQVGDGVTDIGVDKAGNTWIITGGLGILGSSRDEGLGTSNLGETTYLAL
ncbi:MAG: hypothetical protein L0Z49_14155, partial [Actinobacteria bacterium]|nr:hypothetical protein [Actinomycetota bacterium]